MCLCVCICVYRGDPSKTHSAIINNTLNKLQNEKILTEKVGAGLKSLKVCNAKTLKLHLLQKKHKENNPDRPMISLVNCHTDNISKYVDHHLQSLVNHMLRAPQTLSACSSIICNINQIIQF